MINDFQNTLDQSLQHLPKWLEFSKTSRYKRLRYFTKRGWGNGVITLCGIAALMGVAVSSIWIGWIWTFLAAIAVMACTVTAETLLQHLAKNRFVDHSIKYHENSLAIATAAYKLKALEECKKAGATLEQMEDLQKLALTNDAPQGWWEFVFKQAKASVEKEKQHHLSAEKSQEEQQALIQIQQIIDPVVSIEQDTGKSVKHKTLQL